MKKFDFRRMKIVIRTVMLFLIAVAIVVSILIPAVHSNAALNQGQLDRNNPDNYFSVEFEEVPISEIVFFVAEQTEQSFVLLATDTTLSWVQSNIYRDDLVKEFENILTASGLIQHRSGTGQKTIVITAQPSAISSATDSVGYYTLKHIKADVLTDTSEILYANRLAINPLEGTGVVLFSGDPQDVSQFLDLIQSVDTPKENDIAVFKLRNITVNAGIKALNDGGIVEEKSYVPDYWNRSILVRGSDYQKNAAEFILKTIDQPQTGWIDEVYTLHTTTAETVIPILNATHGDCTVMKISEKSVLLSGLADKVDAASRLLTKVDGTGLQVRIEAVVAYLTDTEFYELGLQLQGGSDSSKMRFALNESLVPTVTGTLIDWFESNIGITFSAENNTQKGQIISSPVMTVLNGRKARLHVGRNVPYISEQNYDKNSGTTTGTSIERHDVGLTFEISPLVAPGGDFVTVNIDNVISSITPESAISQNFVDVVLDKQEISSDVIVANGETIFLGGLRIEETGDSLERIPFLSSIPLIGEYMFTYTSDKKEKRNLVVSMKVDVIGRS